MNALYLALAIPCYLLGIYAWTARLILRFEPKGNVLFFVGAASICIGSFNLYSAFA